MFKDLNNKIRNLCTPAFVYFTISAISIAMMIVQNVMSPKHKYCIGMYECNMVHESSKIGFFIGKILYLAFWTFVLNLMCNAGYKQLAWFLVVLPILAMFVAIAMIMSMHGVKIRN